MAKNIISHPCAPIEVEVLITQKCNLNCEHCYLKDSLNCKHMSRDLFWRIFKMCKELNVFEFVMSGGEPFVHPGIYEILNKLESKNESLQIKFLTNGLAIREKYLDILKNINCCFQISLDGANAEIHETLRPSGTFYPTIDSIKKIVSLDKKVILGSVLHKKNVRHIEELLEVARKLGVQGINFVNLIKMGMQTEDFLDLQPSKKDKKYFLKKIHKNILQNDITINIDLDFDYYDMFQLSSDYVVKENNMGLCEAATKKCVINSEGDVYPCELFIPTETLKGGNLKNSTLGDIWNNSKSFKYVREKLGKLVKKECDSCVHWDYCRGGCRALTKYLTGRVDKPDPRCKNI